MGTVVAFSPGRWRYPLWGVLTAATILSGCHVAKKARVAPEAVPVTVARAQLEDVPNTLHAFGTVVPFHTVSVRSQVVGVLQEVRFREGDEVTRGQVLFQIDSRPFEAALSQARKALARDMANLVTVQSDARRYGILSQKNYVTKQQAESAQSGAAALGATVGSDKAAIELAEVNLTYCTIRAPITGRTGQINVQQGNLVKANDDTPLVTIVQLKPIRVSFSVPSDDLPNIRAHAGEKLEVLATPGRRLVDGVEPLTSLSNAPQAGLLSFIDNGVDPSTGSILLKADFPNEQESLWPGQFVNVGLTVGKEHSVVVPAEAVETGQKGTYVFVVKPDETVASRPVEVVRSDAQIALISKGVKAGETVVTDGQVRLFPGAKVSVSEGPATASAGPEEKP